MKPETHFIELRDGYKIVEIEKTMDFRKAVNNILMTRKVYHYTSAERIDENTVKLKSHFWVCPKCGRRIPVYDAFWSGNEKYISTDYREVLNWAHMSSDPAHRILKIQELSDLRHCVCMFCRKYSKKYESSYYAAVTEYSHKFTVSTKILKFGYRPQLWELRGSGKAKYPLDEIVEFNFRKGRVSAKLVDSNGLVVNVCDITEHPEWFRHSNFVRILSNYKMFLRPIKREFMKYWGKPLPYSDIDLSIDKFFLMTRFVGFNRRFYASIPFLSGTHRLDASYKKYVHSADAVEAAYEASTLPKSERVRELILRETPELIFYIPELEQFWELIGDEDDFVRFITYSNIHETLSGVHQHPCFFEFFGDYAERFDGNKLTNLLTDLNTVILDKAASYCTMNERSKMLERRTWGNCCFYDMFSDNYDLTPPRPLPDIKSVTIDGYVFRWLESAEDYRDAEKNVGINGNIYVSWNEPTMGVYDRFGFIVAVIEISDTYLVTNAYSALSPDLMLDRTLSDVYRKWLDYYKMEEDNEFWDPGREYMDADPNPFLRPFRTEPEAGKTGTYDDFGLSGESTAEESSDEDYDDLEKTLNYLAHHNPDGSYICRQLKTLKGFIGEE